MSLEKTILAKFDASKKTYTSFLRALRQIVTDLLSAEDVEVLAIEARVKKRDSLQEKLTRENKHGKYSKLEDVTDVCGIRVISYLQEDCDRVCEILRENFSIDECNSADRKRPSGDDQFGYSSSHLILSLDRSRSKLPEYARFSGLLAEVQVRTVLQHAWAALDWKFRYKTGQDAPREVRRKLFRISANLEGCDEDFSEVYSRVTELRSQYSEKLKAHNLDIAINSDSLTLFAVQSEKVGEILAAFHDEGFGKQEITPEGISKTLELLRYLNIEKISQLDRKLNDVKYSGSELASRLKEGIADLTGTDGLMPMSPLAVIRHSLILDLENSKADAVLDSLYKGVTAKLYKEIRLKSR